MTLEFVGDAPVYVPNVDSVKITAVHEGGSVACIFRRSALVAVGCRPADDPLGLLAAFARNREKLEKRAREKIRAHPSKEVTVSASDILEGA
jgi:hypothetical protein